MIQPALLIRKSASGGNKGPKLFIVLLFIFCNAYTQSADTIRKDTQVVITQPLIIHEIDYDYITIKSKQILSFSVALNNFEYDHVDKNFLQAYDLSHKRKTGYAVTFTQTYALARVYLGISARYSLLRELSYTVATTTHSDSIVRIENPGANNENIFHEGVIIYDDIQPRSLINNHHHLSLGVKAGFEIKQHHPIITVWGGFYSSLYTWSKGSVKNYNTGNRDELETSFTKKYIYHLQTGISVAFPLHRRTYLIIWPQYNHSLISNYQNSTYVKFKPHFFELQTGIIF